MATSFERIKQVLEGYGVSATRQTDGTFKLDFDANIYGPKDSIYPTNTSDLLASIAAISGKYPYNPETDVGVGLGRMSLSDQTTNNYIDPGLEQSQYTEEEQAREQAIERLAQKGFEITWDPSKGWMAVDPSGAKDSGSIMIDGMSSEDINEMIDDMEGGIEGPATVPGPRGGYFYKESEGLGKPWKYIEGPDEASQPGQIIPGEQLIAGTKEKPSPLAGRMFIRQPDGSLRELAQKDQGQPIQPGRVIPGEQLLAGTNGKPSPLAGRMFIQQPNGTLKELAQKDQPDLDQHIANLLVQGDTATAQSLFDAKNRLTPYQRQTLDLQARQLDQNALKQAIDISSSPADFFHLMQLSAGAAPIQQPGAEGAFRDIGQRGSQTISNLFERLGLIAPPAAPGVKEEIPTEEELAARQRAVDAGRERGMPSVYDLRTGEGGGGGADWIGEQLREYEEDWWKKERGDTRYQPPVLLPQDMPRPPLDPNYQINGIEGKIGEQIITGPMGDLVALDTAMSGDIRTGEGGGGGRDYTDVQRVLLPQDMPSPSTPPTKILLPGDIPEQKIDQVNLVDQTGFGADMQALERQMRENQALEFTEMPPLPELKKTTNQDAVAAAMAAGGGWPGFAGGGIVQGPTLATLGETGPEMVIPLDPKKRMRANRLINMYKRMTANDIPGFANGGIVMSPGMASQMAQAAESGTAALQAVKSGPMEVQYSGPTGYKVAFGPAPSAQPKPKPKPKVTSYSTPTMATKGIPGFTGMGGTPLSQAQASNLFKQATSPNVPKPPTIPSASPTMTTPPNIPKGVGVGLTPETFLKQAAPNVYNVGVLGQAIGAPKQLSPMAGITMPSMQAWRQFTPMEKETFLAAVESTGIPREEFMREAGISTFQPAGIPRGRTLGFQQQSLRGRTYT